MVLSDLVHQLLSLLVEMVKPVAIILELFLKEARCIFLFDTLDGAFKVLLLCFLFADFLVGSVYALLHLNGILGVPDKNDVLGSPRNQGCEGVALFEVLICVVNETLGDALCSLEMLFCHLFVDQGRVCLR